MVLPILNKNNVECSCVLIGNYLLTAGHVIETIEAPHIQIDKEVFWLDHSRIVKQRNDNDENGYDLAIYYIPKKKSTLKLMAEPPFEGMKLDSVSYRMSNNGYDKVECQMEVGGICGNYFTAYSSLNLKAGTSGSPVLYNGKVAGILCLGNNSGHDTAYNKDYPLNFCVLLSSKAILHFMEEL